jgi:hypothetical protein
LLRECEYLANDLCLRLVRNRLAVDENHAIGNGPNVLSLGAPARVYRLPLVRASRILHFGGNQLKDRTKGIHCRFELDIAVLTSVQQHTEFAKPGDRGDAIQRHSPHAVDSDHQHALWASGFGRSLEFVDEVAQDLASAFGARADAGKLSRDDPAVAHGGLGCPLLLVLKRRLLG